MELLKLVPFFLFFSLCSFVVAEPGSQCLGSGPEVRFPFRLTNQNQPGSRGYPGFDLSCDANNKTIIHLNSGKFIVREIDYTAQQIRINDPDFTCLPEKILFLNLSGTPFRGAFYQEFSFFSCSSGRRPELEPISCLSNSTRYVYATSSSPAVRSSLFGSCHVVKTVSVPVRPPGFGEVPSSSPDRDLVLQWDLPGCRDCESQGWRCGIRIKSKSLRPPNANSNGQNVAVRLLNTPSNNNSGLEIECLFDQHREPSWRGLVLYFVLVCIMLCFCCRVIQGCDYYDSGSEEIDPITPTTPYHPEHNISIVQALEHMAIESDPKCELGLGDSGGTPSPDEPSCPICLLGFKPPETPKVLHPCQHSFHARCIDAWLTVKPTCPLCRVVSEQIIVTIT